MILSSRPIKETNSMQGNEPILFWVNAKPFLWEAVTSDFSARKKQGNQCVAESEVKISYFEKQISGKYNKDLWLNLQATQMVFDDALSQGKRYSFFTLKQQLYRFGIIWQNITLLYVCNQCICKLMVRSCWQSGRYFKHVLCFQIHCICFS